RPGPEGLPRDPPAEGVVAVAADRDTVLLDRGQPAVRVVGVGVERPAGLLILAHRAARLIGESAQQAPRAVAELGDPVVRRADGGNAQRGDAAEERRKLGTVARRVIAEAELAERSGGRGEAAARAVTGGAAPAGRGVVGDGFHLTVGVAAEAEIERCRGAVG